MRCTSCGSCDTIEMAVRQELQVVGVPVNASVSAVKCLHCGQVEPANGGQEAVHLAIARQVLASGTRSREAFDYAARVVGLNDDDLARALGVIPRDLQRMRERDDEVPAPVLARMMGLLGPGGEQLTHTQRLA